VGNSVALVPALRDSLMGKGVANGLSIAAGLHVGFDDGAATNVDIGVVQHEINLLFDAVGQGQVVGVEAGDKKFIIKSINHAVQDDGQPLVYGVVNNAVDFGMVFVEKVLNGTTGGNVLFRL
jgi:hypothetical protein